MRIGSVLHSSGGKPGCKEPSTFPACQLRLRPAESVLRLTPLEALVIEHGFIRLIFRAMPLEFPSAKALSKDHIMANTKSAKKAVRQTAPPHDCQQDTAEPHAELGTQGRGGDCLR
jgi:hypothetical protein